MIEAYKAKIEANKCRLLSLDQFSLKLEQSGGFYQLN